MESNKEYLKFLKTLLKLTENNTEHFDKLNNTGIRLSKNQILDEITKINLSNKFGFELLDRGHTCYTPKGFSHLDYHIILAHYDGQNREINNISPTPQPTDEWLLKIIFPTGAYFLIDDGSFYKPCISDLFSKMLEEFLALNPKYVDRLNKCMYFTSDNAKEVLDKWDDITTKYKNLVGDELKKLKIEKLKAELEELNGGNA
jgi:hypothetical protein